MTRRSPRRPVGALYRIWVCASPRWLALLAASAGLPTVAAATTANDLCAPNANPCEVSLAVNVTPGSVIDFGNRQLIIKVGGSLNVGTGDMTIVARDVSVDSGGALRGPGGVGNEGGSISIITDTAALGGEVDVSGAPGGRFSLQAGGDIVVGGTVNASSRRSEEDGGTVEIQGAGVLLSGNINARGSRAALGGEIDVIASGDLTISGSVNASGDDGGTIALEAGSGRAGNLTLTSGAEVVADTTGADGSGDFLDVTVTGDGVQSGHLQVDGHFSLSANVGGDAGSMDFSVSGNISAGPSGEFSATARFGGDGGDIDFTTDEGGFNSAATIESSGTGTGARAGDITLDIARETTIQGAIDARGGRDGGDIDVSSDIDDVTIDGSLRSEGSAMGRSGSIAVAGCIVTLSAPATLSSIGPSGLNRMTGATLSVLAGTMRADLTSGTNEIVFGDEMPLVMASAAVTPELVLRHDPNLVACGVTRTPTPTVTATPTPSATRTPRLGPCLGDCNGDGQVGVDELVIGVSIGLDQLSLGRCPAFAGDGGNVDVQDLVLGVSNAIDGCQ